MCPSGEGETLCCQQVAVTSLHRDDGVVKWLKRLPVQRLSPPSLSSQGLSKCSDLHVSDLAYESLINSR